MINKHHFHKALLIIQMLLLNDAMMIMLESAAHSKVHRDQTISYHAETTIPIIQIRVKQGLV